ncbi:MAG: SpoIIE family protein phosphatase [Syntrophomonadaceae bacterium]|nr:SpoIIE family protein phosphatase [Syntrophomonadaceae bacterium]
MGEMIIRMSLAVLLMVALAGAIWALEQKTSFGRWRRWAQSLTVGVAFGGAAILCTHYGVVYGNMVLNVRDMAPLTAGLFFSPWAGVIAGLIGGVERYIAGQAFAIGAYSSVACAMSTALAGVFAAVCRNYLFEGKKPTIFYAFAIGAIMEAFHLLMLLMTHLDDMTTAFHAVQIAAWPMILFNAVGLMLIAAMFSLLSSRGMPSLKRPAPADTPITKRFQLWLLLFVSAMLLFTFSFTYMAQTRLTLENARSLLMLNAEDIAKEIVERDSNLEQATMLLKKQARGTTRAIAGDVMERGGVTEASSVGVKALAALYEVHEINVVDAKGIIIASTNDDYNGFDMAQGSQSAEFMVLVDRYGAEILQDFQPISYDSSISIMYVGVGLPGGYIQVGYNDDDIASFENLAEISSLVAGRHIGEKGYAFLADAEGNVVSKHADFTADSLAALGIPASQADGSFFFAAIEGGEYYCYLTTLGNYRALLTMDTAEMYENRDIFAYEMALMELLAFAAVFGLIFVLVRQIIVRNLTRVNESLARITGGNLNELVSVRDSAEFASLSDDINSTVAALKRYIAEAENRIAAELEFARAIQLSALPSVFPPFPDRKEFELFACMHTAQEVGGDFYDFFLVDENHLALVMADVSGKGIPAALFMMKSKTLIKSLADSGLTPGEIFMAANLQLCEGNDAEMFVTAWLGILDIRSGVMTCVNAGHEYPIIRRAGGAYELYKDKHGFVLGGMEGIRYREYTLELLPGDRIFLYTDGVTEATDAHQQLFGTGRMLDALNGVKDEPPEATLAAVKAAIDGFVADAPQFDDITMLGLWVKPQERRAELTLAPEEDAAQRATDFAEEYFTARGVPFKTVMKLNVAVDEIVSNILRYSGAKQMTVSCLAHDGQASIRFIDDGIPYNPLAKSDPDVSLTAEEREIGGLGIFMVKKSMDGVHYENQGGLNILTVEKSFAAGD